MTLLWVYRKAALRHRYCLQHAIPGVQNVWCLVHLEQFGLTPIGKPPRVPVLSCGIRISITLVSPFLGGTDRHITTAISVKSVLSVAGILPGNI